VTLAGLDRLVLRLTRWIAFVGLVALLAFAALSLVNALARTFGAPITGVRDFEKLIIAVAVAACIPAVMAARQNIAIRAFGRGQFGRALDLAGAVLGVAILAVLSWELQRYVGGLWRTGETTDTIGMPIALWWQGVAALFMLATAVQALVVVAMAAALIRGRPDPAPAGTQGGGADPA
jgi:hypothetical protein